MGQTLPDTDFVRTDIARDVLTSLELLDQSLRHHDTSWLKWSIQAAHMAASSAMVGYLTHTSGLGALTEASTKKMLSWLERMEGTPPADKIAGFSDLIQRVANGQSGTGEPAEDFSSLVTDLEKLNNLRNGFNHFRDHGWSIYIPSIASPLKAAIVLLVKIDSHGWAFRHGDSEVRQRIRALLETIPRLLEARFQSSNASASNL